MNDLGIIFDLDGTLLDSLRDIADSANHVLLSLNQPTYGYERYQTLVGDGVRKLFERALADAGTVLDELLLDDCMRRFVDHYAANLSIHTRPYDGVTRLVESLAAGGTRLAILSNKPDALTKRLVSHHFGDGAFWPVLGQRDSVARKPDPAGVLEIAREWGVAADRIAYVGDTNTDMLTANAAGCFAIGVTWGFRSKEELIRSGADQVVDVAAELAELLEARTGNA